MYLSKEIKKEAIDAIEGILKQNNLNKVTSFINGDKLYEFMEEHLPEATVLEKFQEIQKILDNASPHYRILANQHQNGLQISLVPKYAGAEKEHPINFSLKVDFPDTTEAQEIKGAFERHIATGEPVTITKQYIGKLGIPEFLRSTLQIGTENIGGITLKQEPSKKPFIASFEAESNDAQKTELEYVDLRAVQIGKEEITLTNDNQPVPWKTKLVLNYKEKKMIFTCSVKVSEYLCHRVLQGLKFLETLSKGCVFKITHLDSGFILQNEIIKSGVYPSPNAELIKLVEALDFIQTKVQVPLCIPNTNFSNEEVKTIYETSHKIKTGQVKFGVKDLTISTDKAGAGTILSNYKNNKLSDFKVELEEFVNIFGISIPMGQVTYICYNAYIDKEDLALLRKLLRKPDQEQFSIRFKPSGDKTISAYYHRWKSD